MTTPRHGTTPDCDSGGDRGSPLVPPAAPIHGECGADERPLGNPPTLPDARPVLRLDHDDHQPLPPLGSYEDLEEIGRGGMGIVYRARRKANGEMVALKVIRKERLGNADHLARFQREALASSRLQHPNIVAVVEADFAGTVPYLVMEFVPGITLQKLVEELGPLPIGQACDFMRQTAVALQHAHEQGLVHRDVKPGNLMALAPAGLPLPPRPVIKVLDMGVARLFQSSEHDVSLTTLTRDGSVIGTPDYIAPEQLENPRGVDIRADLYSLGCTFYYLLTGEVPFPGGSLVQKLDWQRWKVAPSPNQKRRDVSSSLAAVVRKLMQKAPDDRFQTPGELANALETLLRTGELPGSHQPAAPTAIRTLSGHTGPISSIAFAPDGQRLLSTSGDQTVRVWDIVPGRERSRLGDNKAGCSGIAVTGSSQVIAGRGVTLVVYDLNTGRETHRLRGHSDTIQAVAASGDGRRAVSGGKDRSVRVWDLEHGSMTFRFTRHTDTITGLALSPDGKFVLSASRDGTLRLWEATTGRETFSFAVPRGPVLCVAWSPDAKTIVSGHFDTDLRLWDASTGRELRRFAGHKQMVVSAAFTATGVIVSASHDRTVKLWDPASGGEIGTCQGHSDRVLTVATGQGFIASGGVDCDIRLWQVPAIV